jgi:ankyrin repeat protein
MEVAMIHRIQATLAVVAGLALLAAAPAAGQTYSDGYKFLQAVEKQDGAKIEELLNKSSTVVNARDLTDGHTALHIAVKAHAYTMLSYLLGKGADPNVADKKGVTPLMLASQAGFTDAVVALARSGARVDEPNDTGETPLIMAVHARQLPMVRVLLAAGANPDRADNSGRSARDYAKLQGGDSLVLAEMTKHDKDKAARKPQGTYGPKF